MKPELPKEPPGTEGAFAATEHLLIDYIDRSIKGRGVRQLPPAFYQLALPIAVGYFTAALEELGRTATPPGDLAEVWEGFRSEYWNNN